MLKVDGLNVYFGSQKVLDGVTLDLPTGVMAGLIGRNGAGKTTFMRAVMGLIARMDGRIAFGNDDLTNLPAHRRAGLGIGYMPEDPSWSRNSRRRKTSCCRPGRPAWVMRATVSNGSTA